jgi:hypothetical protein
MIIMMLVVVVVILISVAVHVVAVASGIVREHRRGVRLSDDVRTLSPEDDRDAPNRDIMIDFHFESLLFFSLFFFSNEVDSMFPLNIRIPSEREEHAVRLHKKKRKKEMTIKLEEHR